MRTVMICFHNPRLIRRVDMERIEERADLLHGSEILHHCGARFEDAAFDAERVAGGGGEVGVATSSLGV